MARLSLLGLFTAVMGAAIASCEATTGYTQMLTYVKRHPSLTREEFWSYWQTQHAPKVAPLASHVGIVRYQQIQVAGKVSPTPPGEDADELVEFDGIAMFLYPTEENIEALTAHAYYGDVIAPDEAKFIDKAAVNAGSVATYSGSQIEVVEDYQNVWVGDAGIREEYQKKFEAYASGS